MKFTQEVKDKWITALESGDYKKGTGQLKNGNKYCCMGVLAEITDGVSINEFGVSLAFDSKTNSVSCYSGGLGIDEERVNVLVRLNDDTYNRDETFENIIPHIKELEVEV
jgi:hypothetical protein